MHFLIAFAFYFTRHPYMEIHGQDYYPCFTQPAGLHNGVVKLCPVQPLGGQHGPTSY